MKAVKNAEGVILNAAVLQTSQVVHKPVRCPGCGQKDFKMWPEGWDEHAAYKCKALERNTRADRKIEFKATFRRLFRD